ncbi:uncharacterized protein LOC117654402 [Thrips palmi]|uniref:Uncharacterized protein LOC117654402 n=1 Tax=Thrips palmi TaxID=161013 RepID=A0A6P9AHQ3_THRPL|nr:uncharacterized protein LOC117654402 [Thrips palmi]
MESMDEEDVENVPLSPEEIEFEQTVARYDEVLAKLKLLRARLLMNSANLAGDLSKGSRSSQDVLDVTQSLNVIEEKFHYLSIQEEMLKQIKVSTLACEIVTSDSPNDGLDTLLKEHCANQAKLLELSKSIRNEKLKQKKGIEKLLDRLSQFTASLKDDQEKLDGNSEADSETNLKLKQSLEKQIKDIRFMQICISQIIVNKQVDLRQSQKLTGILKSARSPITSIEHFIS